MSEVTIKNKYSNYQKALILWDKKYLVTIRDESIQDAGSWALLEAPVVIPQMVSMQPSENQY